MIKAEVQWLQRNDLTRLDYDARYAAELSNLTGLDFDIRTNPLCFQTYLHYC